MFDQWDVSGPVSVTRFNNICAALDPHRIRAEGDADGGSLGLACVVVEATILKAASWPQSYQRAAPEEPLGIPWAMRRGSDHQPGNKEQASLPLTRKAANQMMVSRFISFFRRTRVVHVLIGLADRS